MFGFLHRVARKRAPNMLDKLTQPGANMSSLRSLRSPEKRHSYQLRDPCESIVTRQFNRSAFGLIYTYNLLPQVVVGAPIEFFRRFLQYALIRVAQSSLLSWQYLFSHGIRNMTVEKFQSLFVYFPPAKQSDDILPS